MTFFFFAGKTVMHPKNPKPDRTPIWVALIGLIQVVVKALIDKFL